MDPDEFDHRYSREDALELAGAQAFSVIVAALAGIAVGVAFFDAALTRDQPLNFPYKSAAAIAVASFAFYNALSIPSRYAFIWHAPKARRRIASCLLQVGVTGIALAISGGVIAAFRVEVWEGQSIYLWAAYGVLAAGALHAFAGFGALALLKQGRELPELEDD